MSNFEFQEIDTVGKKTLQNIGNADNFNKWMFDTIKPFCSGHILEIGSGNGNISMFLLKSAGTKITLSDIRQDYCDLLSDFFNSYHNKNIINLNIVHPDFDEVYLQYLNSFDSVVFLNVLEHIEDDNRAIINCKKLLKQNGRLIVLVPAHQSLYSNFDKGLGHYRRYCSKSLKKLFISNNFRIVHLQAFNAVGILGWFISLKLLGRNMISKNQMNIYNKFVWLFKLIDKVFFYKLGLSVVIIGDKSGN